MGPALELEYCGPRAAGGTKELNMELDSVIRSALDDTRDLKLKLLRSDLRRGS